MEFFKSHFLTKRNRLILWIIAGVLFAFLIFHAGIVVGSHQGMRVRPGPGGERGFHPPFGDAFNIRLPDGYMPRGHGAVGTISGVTLPLFSIAEPNGMTENIYVSTTTRIDAQDSTSSNALATGRRVIIFGEPDQTNDRIDAKVIRIFP